MITVYCHNENFTYGFEKGKWYKAVKHPEYTAGDLRHVYHYSVYPNSVEFDNTIASVSYTFFHKLSNHGTETDQFETYFETVEQRRKRVISEMLKEI